MSMSVMFADKSAPIIILHNIILGGHRLCAVYTSLYVSYTSGTDRILREPNLVHTLDYISLMIHRVYATICCERQPYILYSSCHAIYGKNLKKSSSPEPLGPLS